MQKRTKLIIWLYSLKQVNKLKHYGLIHYVSKNMKYVVMYLNEEKTDEVVDELLSFPFVRDFEEIKDKVIEQDFDDVFDKVKDIYNDKSSNDERLEV